MMKFMNCVIVLVILCEGTQSIGGEALQCKFGDISDFIATLSFYSCSVTELENPNDNKIITGYSGVHQPNKYDWDVNQLYIARTNTKYIPAGLGSLSNLTALLIDNSQLVEIRSKDFQGMQNLEYLDLYDNKLTSVPSDVFSTLSNLKVIYLHSNQIKYIGSGVFDQLANLDRVILLINICLNKDYKGPTAITRMKEDIKANCQNPNDVIQYEIQHKISDETSKNREENQKQFKALNGMMKQLLNEFKDLKMEHQENINLRAELSTAKDQQKKKQGKIIKVTNEREHLEKKLNEAQETIQQKLPKMEQTINEFHMEVMDQKIERHHQRELYREIRSKLMKCEKEKLEV